MLLVDADSGLRNLDIVLGMTDQLLFSFSDVIAGRASLKGAAVKHPIVKNLRVLTAPASSKLESCVTKEKVAAFLQNCRLILPIPLWIALRDFRTPFPILPPGETGR